MCTWSQIAKVIVQMVIYNVLPSAVMLSINYEDWNDSVHCDFAEAANSSIKWALIIFVLDIM